MAWHSTAPIRPDESVERLAEVLERQEAPLLEIPLKGGRKDFHAYAASTSIGKVCATASSAGWNVFYSPKGTRNYISLWDWRELAFGEPRPRKGSPATKESVEWIIELLEKGEPPEIDPERVEEYARKSDKLVAQERRLNIFYLALAYTGFIAVLAWATAAESMAGIAAAAIALPKLVIATLKIFGLKVPKGKE